MSNYLIDEYPLIVLPTLAQKIGLNEAIVLQQVHFWMGIAKKKKQPQNHRDGKWWVRNTYSEWRQNNFPFWSVSTIKRAVRNLEEKELIVSGQLDKNKYSRSKWYTIDYERLQEVILDDGTGQNDPIEPTQNDPLTTGQNEPFISYTDDLPDTKDSLAPSGATETEPKTPANGYPPEPDDYYAICGKPPYFTTVLEAEEWCKENVAGGTIDYTRMCPTCEAELTYHDGHYWCNECTPFTPPAEDDPAVTIVSQCKYCGDKGVAYEATVDAYVNCPDCSPPCTDSPPDPPVDKADEPTLTPKEEHTLYKNAILAAFGWLPSEISSWGKIDKAAKDLRKLSVPVDDIRPLHRYCSRRFKDFGPNALPTWWAAFQKERRDNPSKPLDPEELAATLADVEAAMGVTKL